MSLGKDARILVVDDMLAMRIIITKGLAELGYEDVTHATDGKTALRILEKSKEEGRIYDLIISDWNMPVMSGIKLLENVRQDDELKDIPFLMITAESEEKSAAKAVEIGVTHFIIKPFTIHTLENKIEKIFNSD
jgi:two-component system chemotaxis response regulator CheY